MNTQTKTRPQQQTNAPQQQQQVATQRPQQQVASVPLHEELNQRQSEFRAALPAHIPVERFKRVILTAVSMNPSLIKADRRSFFNSAMKAAQDGLLPDGREGALVIYNNRKKIMDNGSEKWVDNPTVQWMPMIAGLRKKVRNSQEIATWDVKAVYARDKFVYREGIAQTLEHTPYIDGPPGDLVAVYSIARLKSGEISLDVMPKWQVDKVRAISKSKDKGPWVDFYDEMAKKTVARRHSKVLPMSTDLDDLIRRDDTLYNLEGASDREVKSVGSAPPRPQLSDFTADPNTGEITDIEEVQEQEQPKQEQQKAAPKEDKKAPAANSDKVEQRADQAPGDDKGSKKSSGADPEAEKAAETKSPTQLARDVGYQHAKEGRKLRAMPPEYADNEEQKAAYEAGFDLFFEEQRAND